MEFEPQEQAIVDLLAKLKNANGEYPSNLMTPRREMYLKQIANAGLGLGLGVGIKNATKTTKSATGTGGLHLPALTGTSLFEAILVVAIVVEAGVAAYNYRDRIVEFFASLSSTPGVEEVIPPSFVESPQPEVVASESLTPVETPTAPTTLTTSTTGQPADGGTNGNNSASATPDPNDGNGNHYGQTKVPRATKANSDGSTTKPDKKP